MEEQLLASTKALKTIEKPLIDPKTRLISMITDYTISLSEGMMQLSVSAKDKQAIVEREVKEVEDVFRESIRQLYAWCGWFWFCLWNKLCEFFNYTQYCNWTKKYQFVNSTVKIIKELICQNNSLDRHAYGALTTHKNTKRSIKMYFERWVSSNLIPHSSKSMDSRHSISSFI